MNSSSSRGGLHFRPAWAEPLARSAANEKGRFSREVSQRKETAQVTRVDVPIAARIVPRFDRLRTHTDLRQFRDNQKRD